MSMFSGCKSSKSKSQAALESVKHNDTLIKRMHSAANSGNL